jgi:hypothetical protein
MDQGDYFWGGSRVALIQHGNGRDWHDAATSMSIHGSRLAACVACSLPNEHTAFIAVMSQSTVSASIPVESTTANCVQTYVHVHGPHSLAPVTGGRMVDIEGRLHHRSIWLWRQQRCVVLLES